MNELRTVQSGSITDAVPSRDPEPKPEVRIGDYRPIRALLFWLLVAGGVVALIGLGRASGAAGETAGAEPGILAGIWLRSIADPYCQMMIVGGLAVFSYLMIQGVAMSLETATLMPEVGTAAAGSAGPSRLSAARGFLAEVSGRPAVSAARLANSQTHVEVGIDLLLHPLRYAQTLFPAVGFIGTVVGISGAVRALPDVLRNQAVDELLKSLHVAFDTTFLGLVVATVVGIGLVLLDFKHAQLRALQRV